MTLFGLRFRLMQKLYWLFGGINFTFLPNYNIWQLFTIGNDYPMPVDKHDSDQNFTSPPGVKIQLFQNNVMLHIKLKGITNAATLKQIFCPQTPSPPRPWGWDQKVKIQFFQNMIILHIKLKGIMKCSNMVANILPTDPPIPPHLHPDPGDWVNRSKLDFFKT